MGEAKLKANGAAKAPTAETAAATAPPPPEVAAEQLTIDDVNALLRSYQNQIVQKTGEVANLTMELARRDRTIASLRAAMPKELKPPAQLGKSE